MLENGRNAQKKDTYSVSFLNVIVSSASSASSIFWNISMPGSLSPRSISERFERFNPVISDSWESVMPLCFLSIINFVCSVVIGTSLLCNSLRDGRSCVCPAGTTRNPAEMPS